LGAVNKYSWRKAAEDYAKIYESVFLEH